MTFTHKELTKLAAKWLQTYCRCPIVARELVAYTISGETPDAIGWISGCCILVECKTSKADFLQDQKKPSRRLAHLDHPALGHKRVYLAPEGVLDPKDIPEGWALYEVKDNGKIRFKSGEKISNGSKWIFKSCQQSEKAILTSIIRRLNNWKPLIAETNLGGDINGLQDQEETTKEIKEN